jgi:flagellar motility protein MotE (MotC chaperone)
MPPDFEADMTSIVRILRYLAAVAAVAAVAAALLAVAHAQDGKPAEAPKAKASADKAAAEKTVDPDVGRYCANVVPSIEEARIAWQTKRLTELDGQIRQRIADLEKAETSAREWIAKRDELTKAAQEEVVAIYAKMEPESAARQIGALDDRMAAAILGKLKPSVAGAILGEMDADRASRLAGLVSGANPEEKKS